MMNLSLNRRRQIWAYIFLLIPLAFFLFIRLYPTFFAFNMSLREWNPLSSTQPFVGLENNREMAEEVSDPKSATRKAFQHTIM